MSKHVCFIKSGAYDAIIGNDPGGAEREIYLLAKEFDKRGFDVSLITGRKDQRLPEMAEGLNLIRGPWQINGPLEQPRKALDYLRCMRRADADIYVILGDRLVSVLQSFYCMFDDAKFVYRLTNDGKLGVKADYRDHSPLTQKLYVKALRRADFVTVQTEKQRELLSNMYGVPSTVIPGGYELSDVARTLSHEERNHFLWVGRLDEIKQPTIFPKVAESLPEVEFVMVGPPDTGPYQVEMNRYTDELENFEYRGFVSREELSSLYRHAFALVNTATVEGFPNTFLEAWGYGTPVVSLTHTVDGLLTDEQCGLHAEDSEATLARQLERLHTVQELWCNLSRNAREYVETHHSMEAVVDIYVNEFSKWNGEQAAQVTEP